MIASCSNLRSLHCVPHFTFHIKTLWAHILTITFAVYSFVRQAPTSSSSLVWHASHMLHRSRPTSAGSRQTVWPLYGSARQMEQRDKKKCQHFTDQRPPLQMHESGVRCCIQRLHTENIFIVFGFDAGWLAANEMRHDKKSILKYLLTILRNAVSMDLDRDRLLFRILFVTQRFNVSFTIVGVRQSVRVPSAHTRTRETFFEILSNRTMPWSLCRFWKAFAAICRVCPMALCDAFCMCHYAGIVKVQTNEIAFCCCAPFY